MFTLVDGFRNYLYPTEKEKIVNEIMSIIENEDIIAIRQLNFNPNAPLNTTDGNLPLIYALKSGLDEAVKELLAKGADPTKEDARGLSAIGCAVLMRNEPMFKLLLEHDKSAVDALKDYFNDPAILVQAQKASPNHITTQEKVMFALTLGLFAARLAPFNNHSFTQYLGYGEQGLRSIQYFSTFSTWSGFFASAAMDGALNYALPDQLRTAYQAVTIGTLACSVFKGLASCWKNKVLGEREALNKAIVSELPRVMSIGRWVKAAIEISFQKIIPEKPIPEETIETILNDRQTSEEIQLAVVSNRDFSFDTSFYGSYLRQGFILDSAVQGATLSCQEKLAEELGKPCDSYFFCYDDLEKSGDDPITLGKKYFAAGSILNKGTAILDNLVFTDDCKKAKSIQRKMHPDKLINSKLTEKKINDASALINLATDYFCKTDKSDEINLNSTFEDAHSTVTDQVKIHEDVLSIPIKDVKGGSFDSYPKFSYIFGNSPTNLCASSQSQPSLKIVLGTRTDT